MDRRGFIRSSVGLITVQTLPALGEMTNGLQELSFGNNVRLVNFRRDVADIGNADAYFNFRKILVSQTLSPWLRSVLEEPFDEIPVRFDALIEMRYENNGEMKLGALLDFDESFAPEPDFPELSFVEWLNKFRPESLGDFYMAQPLYSWYRHTGMEIPKLITTPDVWLDAMFKNTRGLLFWSDQWNELFRSVGIFDQRISFRLIRGYMTRQSNAIAAIEQLTYFPTGQSLMDIIKERNPGGGGYGISPGYLVGDWLHRYWLRYRSSSNSTKS
jgi:hypothetical protein